VQGAPPPLVSELVVREAMQRYADSWREIRNAKAKLVREELVTDFTTTPADGEDIDAILDAILGALSAQSGWAPVRRARAALRVSPQNETERRAHVIDAVSWALWSWTRSDMDPRPMETRRAYEKRAVVENHEQHKARFVGDLLASLKGVHPSFVHLSPRRVIELFVERRPNWSATVLAAELSYEATVACTAPKARHPFPRDGDRKSARANFKKAAGNYRARKATK
jgi:hypothetical protein